jgi:hypothetical protein
MNARFTGNHPLIRLQTNNLQNDLTNISLRAPQSETNVKPGEEQEKAGGLKC